MDGPAVVDSELVLDGKRVADAADARQHRAVGRARDEPQQTVDVVRFVDQPQTALRDVSVGIVVLPLHDVIVRLVVVEVERVAVVGAVQRRKERVQNLQIRRQFVGIQRLYTSDQLSNRLVLFIITILKNVALYL